MLEHGLLEKLKKKDEATGNKLDVSGGKICGDLVVEGKTTIKQIGDEFGKILYPVRFNLFKC